MPPALLAMSLGTFGIGTTEFVTMGLLPEIAGGVDISIPTAGHLISAYAVGVVIGAPLLTALGSAVPRKAFLLGTIGLFALGNLLTAVAGNYESLLVARLLTGMPHGAFFGSASVVAAGLVDPGRRARAVSVLFLGLTLANVAGVPVGTYLGQRFGWRWTFAMVAVLGLASLLSILAALPRQSRPSGGIRDELGVFRRLQVWLALAVVMLGFGGTFACFSYITPMMTSAAGYEAGDMTWLLMMFGVGMSIGTFAGGRLADRALLPSLYACLSGLGLTLGLFAVTAHGQVSAAVTLLLIGVTGFSAGPIVQTLIMRRAEGAPSLASASVHSAFNIANAMGAYLGGLVIAGGLGITAPNWVGAALAFSGLIPAIASGLVERRGEAVRRCAV
ncbi:DHA1 family inner membrane transport protein [Saccharopolyspora lacisalsi]|uniref:DHA1 family inner membrane transport protein n=1 Tax=Halosaccharopolyspora lacisalsi TaxID=1000566 RepID=A0A839DV52_9PSEU|nr:MFS transporter [Halosaccharopolyspora lacisalsi]MBA8823041.1 DHA1 family inner membrane transport protein [Halosaccharopolyspora lacisalsi]